MTDIYKEWAKEVLRTSAAEFNNVLTQAERNNAYANGGMCSTNKDDGTPRENGRAKMVAAYGYAGL